MGRNQSHEQHKTEHPERLDEPCLGGRSCKDLEADRKHLCEAVASPFTKQRHARSGGISPADVVKTDELLATVFQRVGERETWLAIANDFQNVEVFSESVVRLSRELAALVDEPTG
ncbi:hypothetical protein [Corynebacterium glyciniphilum]|uniref:hypothetical protein n=1 Tax=Corynebacterium glyciniphilum TaxID=1404244 RepID=UPI003FD6A23E